jgi:hypothetical protein
VERLVLKLVLTPLLVAAVSLAGRRWGPGVSGWLVGFPFTSGPVVFFVALEQGVAFATAAAIGSMSGTIAQAAFCVLYGRLAGRCRWGPALLTGSLAFAAATVVLRSVTLVPIPLLLGVIGTLPMALVLMPRGPQAARAAPLPRWDLPARVVVTTVIVLLLTGAAPLIGPTLTGLLATFPLYGAVLAGFAHHLQGPGHAIRVLRGLLLGLFAFAGFFFVLALSIERAGIVQAFAAAIVAALVLQGGALWVMRREVGP